MMRFIHIPKNAGTTVGKMLGRNHIPFAVGLPDQQHTRHRYAYQFRDGLPSFAIVRNPLTRMVSFFHWIRRLPRYADLTFDEFIHTQYERGRAAWAWTPQATWTHDLQLDKQLVTHILRYERLREDLHALFPQIRGKWLHLNAGNIADHMGHYDGSTRRVVERHFRMDFELFGY